MTLILPSKKQISTASMNKVRLFVLSMANQFCMILPYGEQSLSMSNAIDHGCGTMGLWQPLSSHRGRAFLREAFLYFAN